MLFTVNGDQDPVMLLFEVFTSNGAVCPVQKGDNAVNVGTVGAFTVTGTVTNGDVQLPKDAGPTICKEIL